MVKTFGARALLCTPAEYSAILIKIYDFWMQQECETECTMHPTCRYYWFSQQFLGWCQIFTDCPTTTDVPDFPSQIYKRIFGNFNLYVLWI